MAGIKLQVKVVDKATNEPISGAVVDAVLTEATDSNGVADMNIVWITVTHSDYTSYENQPYTNPDMGVPIAIGLDVKPPEPIPEPIQPLPNLLVRDHYFMKSTGEWFTCIQCSDFNLMARYQHGEDISGILAQRKDAGFNMLRVWTSFDIPGIGTYLDINYPIIPSFVKLCSDFGLYVEFCAYTGINNPDHWNNLIQWCQQAKPIPLLELVNELSENTNEPDPAGRVFNLKDYNKPVGVLASRGSNGSEKFPVGNDLPDQGVPQWDYFGMTESLPAYWDYVTMHFNDAYEWTRKVGHNSMPEEFHVDIPCLANENTRYTDKSGAASGLMNPSTDPNTWAYDAAAGAALLCAGSCFHSIAGKTSELWDAAQFEAAKAWADGARSVNISYQDGNYSHPIELETPDLLRVYQRKYSGSDYAQVNIRK